MKKVFTTGDVARTCRVTINTVVKWFDTGELKGYRIPNSGTRRVPKKDLLAFMRKHNFPMDEIVSDKVRILVVARDSRTWSQFRRAFPSKEHYSLQNARSGFEAGLMAKEFTPDFIFIDVDIADIDSKTVCRALREDKETADITVVAMSTKRKGKEFKELRKQGYVEALSKPLRSNNLREAVEKHSS